MLEHPNLEVLRCLLTGFARNDAEMIRRCVAPGVVFHAPGESEFAGDYRGIEAILAMLDRLVKATDGTLEVQVHDMLANDQHGILMLREKASRKGKCLDFEVLDVHHFSEGLISEIWSRPTDQAAFDSFFA